MEEDKTHWRHECDRIIIHMYETVKEEVNLKHSTGRMTPLLWEPEDLDLESQTCVKQGIVAGVCNPSAPVVR